MNNKNKKREEYEEKVFNGIVRFVNKWKDIVDEGIKTQWLVYFNSYSMLLKEIVTIIKREPIC